MASGRPDWFGTIVAAGKYDTTFIPIGLDETGAILALMKGAYDSVLKTIATDSNGIMKANLAVQDLAEITVRTKYGTADRKQGQTSVSPSTTTSLFTISGKGMIYCGHIATGPSQSQSGDILKIYGDGDLLFTQSFYQMYTRKMFKNGDNLLYLTKYDDTDYSYVVCATSFITYEASFEVRYQEAYGNSFNVHWDFTHALTP